MRRALWNRWLFNLSRERGFVLVGLLAACAGPRLCQASPYDPLAVDENAAPQNFTLPVADESRKREIPLKVYLPSAGDPAPVVLFSHGLGGTREGSAYLGRHWAARGYVAVFLQHPGSDDAVWRDAPLAERMAAMQEAASLKNLLLRVQDVPAVLDQLAKWNAAEAPPTDRESGEAAGRLAKRLDLTRVGMSGHSFGAHTTQAVAGQVFPLVGARYVDPRVKAAVVMSPGAPKRGDPQDAFGAVKIPWLLMTGTKDLSPIGGQTVESRLAVFPALPAGDKFELVLRDGEHLAFTERVTRLEITKRNPNHHRVILALSTAFWDAYLRGDGEAKAWLTGAGPRGVLEKDDGWRVK